ncbi:MAG: hypothetical protein AAGD05_00435, partial [Bacteroidota bacterium]
MKKLLYTSLFFFVIALNQVQALSFVSYQGFTNPEVGTIVIWINADTNFGEGVQAQIRYGAGPTFSGFVQGAFDNTTFPGANWSVTINYPADIDAVDIEVAGCTDFSNCLTSGTLFSGFSNSAMGLLIALPVELSTFDGIAQTKSIQLKWTTESESNNSHFEVERSIDSRSWTTLTSVKGQGTTFERQHYVFEDFQPVSGLNYYRLRQVDFDGQFEYSPTIVLRFKNTSSIALSPNPATDRLLLSTDQSNDEAVQISIYNSTGQLQNEWLQTTSEEL